MEIKLHHRDYVAVNEMGEPVCPLDIIMHYTSIIEEYNEQLEKHGYQFVRMTDLPQDLQNKYLKHLEEAE